MTSRSAVSVTVLLTVYNGMPYLPQAVESIFNQRLPEFIFLIIDNGSTDQTEAYLQKLRDSRLRLVRLKRNIGRVPALNLGLSQINTEFTAIIDADDLADPMRLQKQSEYLRHFSGIALLGSDVCYIDEQGKHLGSERFPLEHEELLNKLPVCNQFAHAACMFRTQAVKAVGAYPEDHPYAHDLALWLALFESGFRAASLPETLASIRRHAGQASSNAAQRQQRLQDELLLTERISRFPGLSPSALQAANLRRAFALWRSGQFYHASRYAWFSFALAPLLFFCNPLFMQRLAKSLHKKACA